MTSTTKLDYIRVRLRGVPKNKYPQISRQLGNLPRRQLSSFINDFSASFSGTSTNAIAQLLLQITQRLRKAVSLRSQRSSFHVLVLAANKQWVLCCSMKIVDYVNGLTSHAAYWCCALVSLARPLQTDCLNAPLCENMSPGRVFSFTSLQHLCFLSAGDPAFTKNRQFGLRGT